MTTTDIAPPISLPAGLEWAPAGPAPATLWITGPHGAGAVGIGHAVRSAMASAGWRVTLVDDEAGALAGVDHVERARRAAEAAVALVDSGVIAIVVIDSPRVRDRELARLVHEARGVSFIEIFVDPSTDARAAAPPADVYEVPPLPDLVVFPGPVVAAVASVMAMLRTARRL